MVKVHINNTKHITIANIYIPPRDSTSTHYKTADTDIQDCIQYITNIPHSVLTEDVNAHSTLWHITIGMFVSICQPLECLSVYLFNIYMAVEYRFTSCTVLLFAITYIICHGLIMVRYRAFVLIIL